VKAISWAGGMEDIHNDPAAFRATTTHMYRYVVYKVQFSSKATTVV
jgi:hypothetical protein